MSRWVAGTGDGPSVAQVVASAEAKAAFVEASAIHPSAADVVEAGRVTGDTANRYERHADGTIALGPGGTTPLRSSEGKVVVDLKGEDTKNGIVVYGSDGADPTGQLFVCYDHLGQPIFSIPVAGGPGVYGDDLRVHAGPDIFNPEVALRKDGSVQVRKGDTGGGAGVLAIGPSTQPPTRNPDGTQTVAGADTEMANVLWVDINGRLFSRRGTGPTDLVGGNAQLGGNPTLGVQPGDTYYHTGEHRVRFHDGASWPKLGLEMAPMASVKPAVGGYLMPPWSTSGGGSALTASQMLLMPIDVLDWGMTFDRVGVQVVGAGVDGTPMTRHGIYADDGTLGRPTGSPLADWGLTAAQTAANTGSLVTINWTPPRLGRYWLAVVYQPTGTVTTAPTYATIFGQALPQTSLDVSLGAVRALVQTGVTGALPAIGSLSNWGTGYSIGLRRSA